MRSLWTLGPALAALVAAPAVASAHIQLTYPLPRTASQKEPNCGLATSTRSANPTVLEPGATITVTWNETINHPGHYRISFDADGEDFTIPLDFDDLTQTENVLVDNIADATGGSYSQEITLPSEPCENCTIQLIQMMTDKPPYGDGNDIYFQCADVALRVGGDPGPDAGVGGDDAGADPGGDDEGASSAVGGCSTAPGGGAASALIVAFGALILLRRRRA